MEIANFFFEGELSKLEKKCIESFVKNGFKVKLWSYSNLQLPNVESCDASLVLDKNVKIKQDFSSKSEEVSQLAAFSDYFRYKVVDMFGGWWFDADCFCLKNSSDFTKLRLDKKIVAGKQFDDYNEQQQICTAVFYMDKSVSSKLLFEFESMLNEIDMNEHIPYGYYGPEFFSNFIKKEGLYENVLEINAFYAIRWFEDEWLLYPQHLEKAMEMTKDSFVSHIWNHRFFLNGNDKNKSNDGSFLHYLYSKYEQI